MTIDDFFDRRVPLAIICALMLQAATAVWWAATKDSDDHFQLQRLDHLEQSFTQANDEQAHVLERLARIEERQIAQSAALDRIERQIARNLPEANR